MFFLKANSSSSASPVAFVAFDFVIKSMKMKDGSDHSRELLYNHQLGAYKNVSDRYQLSYPPKRL